MIEVIQNFFTHIFDGAFVVEMLCIAISTAILLHGFAANKKMIISVLLFAAETVCLSASFLIINVLMTVIAHYSGLIFPSVFMYLIGIVIYAFLRGVHSWISRIAMASIVFSLTALITALGTLLGNAIAQSIEGFDIIITKIMSGPLIVMCSVVLYRYPIYRFKITPFDCILNVVCNVLSAMLVIVYEYMRRLQNPPQRVNDFTWFVSIIFLSLFVINIVTYFITYFLCREKERVLYYQAEKQKGATLAEMLRLSEYNMTELREVRHDIKNQYAYMQSMLEGERYDELKKYFNELIGTFSKSLYEYVDCGNQAVDSILNLELAKASEAQLTMNVKAAIPSELPFPTASLLALFTNVIDNAIEACNRENVHSTIEVVLGMQGDYLLFVVSNQSSAKDAAAVESLPSSKGDSPLHGHGMKIIKKIVKKYNGFHRCYISNGQFVSESLLDMKYKDKN